MPQLQIDDQSPVFGKLPKSAEYEELTDDNCTTCAQAVKLTAKRIKVDTFRAKKQSNNETKVRFLMDIEGADTAEDQDRVGAICVFVFCTRHLFAPHERFLTARKCEDWFPILSSKSQERIDWNDHKLPYVEKRLRL